jgi:hypothetical protein
MTSDAEAAVAGAASSSRLTGGKACDADWGPAGSLELAK